MFSNPTLDTIRREIDSVDETIVMLLGKRTRLVEQIVEVKAKESFIRDENRENEILARLCSLAGQNGIKEGIVEQVYRMLFEHFIELQTIKK